MHQFEEKASTFHTGVGLVGTGMPDQVLRTTTHNVGNDVGIEMEFHSNITRCGIHVVNVDELFFLIVVL